MGEMCFCYEIGLAQIYLIRHILNSVVDDFIGEEEFILGDMIHRRGFSLRRWNCKKRNFNK